MRGVFDDQEPEELGPRRDTELTLGAGMLLLLFLGLATVCGLCFGLGYAVGHHGAQPVTAASQLPAGDPQTSMQGSSPLPKPPATAQPAVTPTAPSTPLPGDAPQPGADLPQAATPAPAPPASNPAATSGSPQVRPALAPPASAPSAVSASSPHPALSASVPVPTVPLTVQIAAVSHQEDADVLIGALRKRSYAVSARREPGDNLIHVRIGPFNNRDEANRWRMKLLNDGYNAMIQP